MVDLRLSLGRLARRRPIFHSEADFQHALAWEIHEQHPKAKIRLEFRPRELQERAYIDLWVSAPTFSAAIELKYKTARLAVETGGERFDLLPQGAYDHGRFDVLKDVYRLEQVVSAYENATAHVVLLTNDSRYWRPATRPTVYDVEFHLHEGKTVSGDLQWGNGASAGTIRNREQGVPLSGCYECRWTDYARASADSAGLFRYLMIPVVRPAREV